jgi:hypothetical protein
MISSWWLRMNPLKDMVCSARSHGLWCRATRDDEATLAVEPRPLQKMRSSGVREPTGDQCVDAFA